MNDGDRLGFRAALDEARAGFDEGGVPIGASLMRGDELVAAAHNRRVQAGDPIAHGEMECIRQGGRRRDYKLMTLFTTLSPCAMCSGAILLFEIPRVVVGEAQTFPGDLGFLRSHGVEVLLLDDPECVALMTDFQRLHPDIWAEDIGN